MTRDELYKAYVIAGKQVRAAYDTCVGRGMSWIEIADDATYREAVADSDKALASWKRTRGGR